MIKKNFPISPTGLINTLAQQKISAGIKVFNLSAGEPKLFVHKIISDAAKQALSKNKIFYPPMAGILELREAAVKWMNKYYNCHINTDQCLVTNGGKFGLYLLFQLLLKKSDEVIFASPYWVSYPAITKIFDCQSCIINTKASEHWKIQLCDLKKKITFKTKILILNNAANPTGIVYTKKELSEILAYAHSKNIFVISDEVYSSLVYDNKSYISCGSFKKYQHNIAIIQSCSKNFSMTGWRVGFVFASKENIKKLTALVSQSTSGVTTISQYCALAAFNHAEKISHWVKNNMQKRRDIIVKALKQYLNITIIPPAAGLYIFIHLKLLGIKSTNSAEFCKKVLEEKNIALVPGIAFGQEGYIRISFGAPEQELIAGIRALGKFIHRL